MQERHKNRYQYFKELTVTSKQYIVPYIQKYNSVETGMEVLEIGCGEGGNLLPFAKMGCKVTGIDIAHCRIEEARSFFEKEQTVGVFIDDDIFNIKGLEHGFDIIICHDVFEHIDNKNVFLPNLSKFLKAQGVVFMAFPAWQMPFGGHQQICKSKFLSHCPFIHLLPRNIYKAILKLFGESDSCIKELLSIKQTRITIEHFEKMLVDTSFNVEDRQLWLVNPHYEVKFGMTPCKMPFVLSNIHFIRNFFSTSCWYILKCK